MHTFLRRRESDEEWDVFVCLGSCLHSVWNYPHEKKGKMPGWNTMKFILTQRMNYAWKGHKSPECLMYRLRRTSSVVLTRWPRNGLDLEHNSFSFSLLSILVSVKLTQIMFKKNSVTQFLFQKCIPFRISWMVTGCRFSKNSKNVSGWKTRVLIYELHVKGVSPELPSFISLCQIPISWAPFNTDW